MTEKKRIPQTIQDLYEMLVENGDIIGKIELDDGSILWRFKEFWLYIFLDQNEGYISVNRRKKHWWEQEQLFHWHPMKEEIYDQLRSIGNKNNVLVIRDGCLGSDIFYLGREDEYKYSPNKKWHWGKLYYLKPQD